MEGVMPPMMRIVLPIIGLFVAASLGSGASRALDLLLGAAVGFLIADLGIIRARLDALAKEFERLKKEFRRREEVPTASAPPRESTIESGATEYPEYKPAHSAPRVQVERPWQDIESPAQAAIPPSGPTSTVAHSSAKEPAVIAAIRSFFTGGNTLVRVGVIVLFFGVAFLLRYMAEHSHISIEVRLTGVALASIAL